jgi:hypothetical protein
MRSSASLVGLMILVVTPTLCSNAARAASDDTIDVFGSGPSAQPNAADRNAAEPGANGAVALSPVTTTAPRRYAGSNTRPADTSGSDDGLPVRFLQDASDALAAGHVRAAQEALERAETRLLIRSTTPSTADRPSRAPLVVRIAAARAALADNDRSTAQDNITSVLATLRPPPPPPPVEPQRSAAPGPAWQQGYWHWTGLGYVWRPGPPPASEGPAAVAGAPGLPAPPMGAPADRAPEMIPAGANGAIASNGPAGLPQAGPLQALPPQASPPQAGPAPRLAPPAPAGNLVWQDGQWVRRAAP